MRLREATASFSSPESQDGSFGAGHGEGRSSGSSEEVLLLQDGVWHSGSESGHGPRDLLYERPHYHPDHTGWLIDKLLVHVSLAYCCRRQLRSPLLWQGFCRYLEDSFGDLKERGVVIGYDARAHPASGGGSKRFASLAAAVFVSRGVPVHLFSGITPTPFVVITQSASLVSFGLMLQRGLRNNPKREVSLPEQIRAGHRGRVWEEEIRAVPQMTVGQKLQSKLCLKSTLWPHIPPVT